MSERKLATIRRIDDIQLIPNADAIEVATIGGWKVVVKKNEFNIGELVVYFEIDSWIPHELAPFLTKSKEPREFNGVKGERLRTVKLRGQVSQGLVLPQTVVAEKIAPGEIFVCEEDSDVTDVLGIQKWEKPIPAQLAGQMKGYFPSFLRKTDQERIQNLSKEFQAWKTDGSLWEVSEKLDGSSMTVYVRQWTDNVEGTPVVDYGVCSRNINLKEDENNSFWQAATKFDLINKIKSTGRNLAIQGELCGPGIQGNQYGFNSLEFFAFDVFDIDKQEYLLPNDRLELLFNLKIKTVPTFNHAFTLSEETETIETVLKFAELGISHFNETPIEGYVCKHLSKPDVSFKVISNLWLMENE